MADFDLLEEVNTKFANTIVMFDKKAFAIKEVGHDQEVKGQFTLVGIPYQSRNAKVIKLSDPALDYKNYNIGYVNGGDYASWWFRKPQKQWAQGLKANQTGYRISMAGGHAHDNFGFSRPFINMLEGIYPDIEVVKKSLIDREIQAMAFHKDFALSYDDIHDDFVLEYHGTKIGASIDRDLKQFKIMPEARYLIEALQEARNVHT